MFTFQVATPIETDGGGSAGELEEGEALMDSDPMELQKQSPPEVESRQEAGKSEAETELEANIKVEVV